MAQITTLLELEIDVDDNGELYDTTAAIQFFVGDFKMGKMHLSEPHKMTARRYKRLSRKDGSLTYCDCNGWVDITSKNGVVTFTTHTAGSGGDGSVEIKCPLENCKHVFTELAKWRGKFE
jgi:hypothetical protein